MTALIARVAGAYAGAPSSTSAMAGPMLPARAPQAGPSRYPPSSTAVSPRFMYPPVGDGTFTTMVATQASAAKAAVSAIIRVRPAARAARLPVCSIRASAPFPGASRPVCCCHYSAGMV